MADWNILSQTHEMSAVTCVWAGVSQGGGENIILTPSNVRTARTTHRIGLENCWRTDFIEIVCGAPFETTRGRNMGEAVPQLVNSPLALVPEETAEQVAGKLERHASREMAALRRRPLHPAEGAVQNFRRAGWAAWRRRAAHAHEVPTTALASPGQRRLRRVVRFAARQQRLLRWCDRALHVHAQQLRVGVHTCRQLRPCTIST